MKSIRAYLMSGLTLVLILAVVISASLSFNRARYEVDELLDAELAQTARVLRSTLTLANSLTQDGKGFSPATISTHDWARLAGDELRGNDERTRFGHSYERKIMFRVLRNDAVILSSDNSPASNDYPREPGYQRIRFDKFDWYLFTLIEGDLVYTVGERSDVREELVSKIALSYLYPSLLAFPLLLFLLAWTLQRGLRPLVQLDRYIQERDKDNLDPIVVSATPSEVKPIVESLNGLLVRLRRSLESERRFTATASHEMRTPIAVIKLNVQNALKAKDENERVHLLQELDVSVDRAGRLINQLLALNRLEQDGHGFSSQNIDILPLLREEIAGLYPLALQKDQSIELVGDDAHLPLNTVPQLLSLLIRNLVDNAIKYSPVKGRIVVSVKQENGAILIQVEDSGPGVPADQHSKIFERFYRISNGDVPGSGLGLAIVNRALELLGGNVALDTSTELGGLRVKVRLSDCATAEQKPH